MVECQEFDRIKLVKSSVGSEEIASVTEALNQPWLINGPYVAEFENQVRKLSDVRNAVAVNSCTAGMKMALAALDPILGDECILPAFNFCAAAQAIVASGFKPVLCDVGSDGNVRAEDLEVMVTPRTRAVLILHYTGWPVQVAEIREFCNSNGIVVIADAAHAMGSSYGGVPVTCCADASVVSFGPTKHIVAGMGGMILTDRDDIAASARRMRTYGMDASMFDRRDQAAPWYHNVPVLGDNSRMSDVNAAVALPQLEKLPEIVEKRRSVAEIYHKRLSNLPYVRPLQPLHDNLRAHSFQYFVVAIDLPGKRDQIGQELCRRRVEVTVNWARTLDEFSAFQEWDAAPRLDNARHLAANILTLPMHQHMTPADTEIVVDQIDDVYQAVA